jgi:FKBP-type peptidyl-prolyl cis-trans isomerase FkpA
VINKKATIGIAVIAVIIIGYLVSTSPQTSKPTALGTESTKSDTSQTQIESVTITPMQDSTEFKMEDITVGTGQEAVSGKKISVNYKGTLTDGTQFDSSYDRGQAFSFNLGAGEVIEGWDKGFAGMKVGGKRKLTIPASMGYGNRPVGSIPANSTLIFEVELLKVE